MTACRLSRVDALQLPYAKPHNKARREKRNEKRMEPEHEHQQSSLGRMERQRRKMVDVALRFQDAALIHLASAESEAMMTTTAGV